MSPAPAARPLNRLAAARVGRHAKLPPDDAKTAPRGTVHDIAHPQLAGEAVGEAAGLTPITKGIMQANLLTAQL